MNITYRVKNVWGNDLMYPVSLDAKFICYLNGTKTLSEHLIKITKEFYPTTTRKQVI